MDISIKNVPEEKLERLRLIDEAVENVPRKLSIEEIAAKAGKLDLRRRNEAVQLVRADRDR